MPSPKSRRRVRSIFDPFRAKECVRGLSRITMMARLGRGSPRFDSLRVPSRRCLFYLIIIAQRARVRLRPWWCGDALSAPPWTPSTVVISGLIISQRRLFRYFCLYIYTIRTRRNDKEEGRVWTRGLERRREDRAGIRAWWTIKAILGRTLVKTHFVASLNPDNSTLRFYPPITA